MKGKINPLSGGETLMEAQTTHRYDVCLTPDQFKRLLAVDQEWVGSEHYMGLAWFWNYAYRFELRDATATQRVRVHRMLLAHRLPLDGESVRHQTIIEDVFGASFTELRIKRACTS